MGVKGKGDGCWTAGGRRERLQELRERRESLFPSIFFTGGELLDWELELQRVPETPQIQLHLERARE